MAPAIYQNPLEQENIAALEISVDKLLYGRKRSARHDRIDKIVWRSNILCSVHILIKHLSVPLPRPRVIPHFVLQRLHQPTADVFVVD